MTAKVRFQRHLKKSFAVVLLTSSFCVMLLNSHHFYEILIDRDVYNIEDEDSRIFDVKPLLKDTTKKILFWNTFYGRKDYNFGSGYGIFKQKKCKVYDCFITHNKRLFDVEDYDAVVFHGAEFNPWTKFWFPPRRKISQKYIYFSQESPANRPASNVLNGFFNLTMTYRLDSDIVVPYFHMSDIKTEEKIAPGFNPKWRKQEKILDKNKVDKYLEIYSNKSKYIAWFVSNCHSKNKREDFVQELKEVFYVDVFGQCGTLKCPKTINNDCFNMLKKDYLFYLAFENSNCQDYVSEKVVNAMNSFVIPVVYSGANLTRFLPPGSYIDATKYTARELADLIYFLVRNPNEYIQYFWWRDYYNFSYAESGFCKLCEMMHQNEWKNSKVYKMKDWWHGTNENPICN